MPTVMVATIQVLLFIIILSVVLLVIFATIEILKADKEESKWL